MAPSLLPVGACYTVRTAPFRGARDVPGGAQAKAQCAGRRARSVERFAPISSYQPAGLP